MRKKIAVFTSIAILLAAATTLTMRCRGKGSKPVTSVLLITVGTLRADHVGCYGGASVSTPAMDELAASGVRFARAYAHNVSALPSHANILSGMLSVAHGVRADSGFRFPGNIETAATLLKARGFTCGAFVGASPLDSRYGLGIGFDVYDDHYGDATEAQDFRLVERRAEAVATPFLHWLDGKQAGAKWFAWVHFNDPHAPYDPVEPYRSKFASKPYDGEIAYVDSQIARILEHLQQKGLDQSTCIILTSDHGEGLGEHNEPTHGVFAYESTLRVPLIVKAPDCAPGTIQQTVQHIDILPTIVELIGEPVPANLKGRSLKPLLYGASEDGAARDIYFESVGPGLDRNWAPLTGIVSGNYKYIDVPITELYDLAKDTGEKENVFEMRSEVAADLKKRLASISEIGASAASGHDQEELDRLASLGYVSTGSSESESAKTYTSEDDPKNLIPLDSMLEDGVAAARAGDLERARRTFSEIISMRPGMSIAYSEVAFVHRHMGQPQKGVEILERALKEGHAATGMLAKLGLCFSDAGKNERAIEVLQQAVRESDDNIDAQTYLGMAYARAGQSDKAISTFENILVDDPGNVAAHVHIGQVYLDKKDYAAATQAINKALQIDARFAPALSLMGDAMAGTGSNDAAISNWKRAIETDPRRYEAIYKLASLCQSLGRSAEAATYADQFVKTAPPARYKREIEQMRKMLARG
ncbi:MAG: sulfatase-like hydrolase/transferase [Acidobacteriota bacterium]